ncbi:MAG: type II toxin-antitoxin system RelE/ParE family toxin [Flavobacteriales bacterium]|nr:type II toxin-antitoxin system RelE/ParE family toxin [Flavobacteriales bacterium]
MNVNRIFWTPTAIESLKEVQVFILNQWNIKVLNHFSDLVENRIDQLRTNPDIAPVIGSTEYRKLIVHANVSLFYVNQDGITRILLIWDNRQNPKNLAKQLLNADNFKLKPRNVR